MESESDLYKKPLFTEEDLIMKKWISIFLGLVLGVYLSLVAVSVMSNDWFIAIGSFAVVAVVLIYAIRTR
jgi:membrane protein YdbS with pleckstrin-like domain